MQRFELSKLSKGIGVACLLAMGSNAHANIQALSPGAYAEAALNLFNFTILSGNSEIDNGNAGGNGSGRSFNSLNIDVLNPVDPTIITQGVNSNGGSRSDLDGGTVDAPPGVVGAPAGTPFAIYTSEGAGYVPNAHFIKGTLDVGETYVGGTTSTYGNALVPLSTAFPPAGPLAPNSEPFQEESRCANSNIGDCIFVQSIVNLQRNGTGAGTSTQGLGVSIQLISTESQWFEVAFDAQAYLRSAIAQFTTPGQNTADSDITWSAKLVNDDTGETFLEWKPDGSISTNLGACFSSNLSGTGRDCYEYADAFQLNSQSERLNLLGVNQGDQEVYFDRQGFFELEAFLEAGVLYTFTIDHKTEANATVRAIPEPTSLALAGIGLIAAGAARRRKSAVI